MLSLNASYASFDLVIIFPTIFFPPANSKLILTLPRCAGCICKRMTPALLSCNTIRPACTKSGAISCTCCATNEAKLGAPLSCAVCVPFAAVPKPAVILRKSAAISTDGALVTRTAAPASCTEPSAVTGAAFAVRSSMIVNTGLCCFTCCAFVLFSRERSAAGSSAFFFSFPDSSAVPEAATPTATPDSALPFFCFFNFCCLSRIFLFIILVIRFFDYCTIF